jgi:hypothetical protein
MDIFCIQSKSAARPFKMVSLGSRSTRTRCIQAPVQKKRCIQAAGVMQQIPRLGAFWWLTWPPVWWLPWLLAYEHSPRAVLPIRAPCAHVRCEYVCMSTGLLVRWSCFYACVCLRPQINLVQHLRRVRTMPLARTFLERAPLARHSRLPLPVHASVPQACWLARR